MRPDVVRRQINGIRTRKADEKRAEEVLHATAFRHLQMDMNVLTGQDSWDKYLQLVEEKQQPDRERLRSLQELSERSDYENSEVTAERHFQMSVLRERIRARDECIRIPQELLAGSEGSTSETR